jgi:hypothetical protein
MQQQFAANLASTSSLVNVSDIEFWISRPLVVPLRQWQCYRSNNKRFESTLVENILRYSASAVGAKHACEMLAIC